MMEHDGRERKAWLTAMACSALGNALLIWLLTASQSATAKKQEPENTVQVDIQMEQIKIEPKPEATSSSIPPPQALKKKTIETSPEQRSEEIPEKATYEGDGNTRAASDAIPVAQEKSRPSLKGQEARTRDDVNLKEQKQTEEEKEEPSKSSVEESQPVKAKEKILSDPLSKEKEELFKKEKPKPVLKKKKAPKKEKQLAEKLRKKFQEPKEKTKMLGSVTRQGEASLDVVDTPLGRYKVALSKAVNREWLKNCLKFKNHIAPGAFYVVFNVDKDGVVSRIAIHEEEESGAETGIQKGFTLKSIQNARIPAMPKAVRKELDNKPLEVTYFFYF